MHQPKPKSAPARLKSKFVKNRTNAMKEIEAWVRKDNEAFPVPEASRMSGQLSDNVTEERMLKAKLWELSKERYKFLSQNSYEQKVFTDRQQRKAGLRRVASASFDTRTKMPASRSSGLDDSPTRGTGPANISRHSSLGISSNGETDIAAVAAKRGKPKNARFSLLDRLDPTKKRGARSKSSDAKPDESCEGTSATKTSQKDMVERHKAGRTLPPKSDHASLPTDEDNLSSTLDIVGRGLPPHAKPAPNPVIFPQKSPVYGNSQDHLKHSTSLEHTTSAGGISHFGSKLEAAPTQNPRIKQAVILEHREDLMPDTGNSLAGASRISSANKRETDGIPEGASASHHRSMTQDPRYERLERTLCPLVRSKTTGDVETIVNKIEALHVRPRKRPPDAKKTKIEIKAYEYMKGKGFVF